MELKNYKLGDALLKVYALHFPIPKQPNHLNIETDMKEMSKVIKILEDENLLINCEKGFGPYDFYKISRKGKIALEVGLENYFLNYC